MLLEPRLRDSNAGDASAAGELKETAQLLGLASVIGEQLLGKEERTLVWRTWGSALGMLPSGGTRVWGTASAAPDDITTNMTSGQTFGCAAPPPLPAHRRVLTRVLQSGVHVTPRSCLWATQSCCMRACGARGLLAQPIACRFTGVCVGHR